MTTTLLERRSLLLAALGGLQNLGIALREEE